MRAWLRRHRWVCGLLAAVLLCGQVAAAAYACPRLGIEPKAGSNTAVELVPMPDCAGHAPGVMDPAQPLLCKAHCEAGQQSVNSGSGATSVPPPALIGALWVRVLDVAHAEQLAAAMPEAQAVGPPAGSPPIYLSLLVLRN